MRFNIKKSSNCMHVLSRACPFLHVWRNRVIFFAFCQNQSDHCWNPYLKWQKSFCFARDCNYWQQIRVSPAAWENMRRQNKNFRNVWGFSSPKQFTDSCHAWFVFVLAETDTQKWRSSVSDVLQGVWCLSRVNKYGWTFMFLVVAFFRVAQRSFLNYLKLITPTWDSTGCPWKSEYLEIILFGCGCTMTNPSQWENSKRFTILGHPKFV